MPTRLIDASTEASENSSVAFVPTHTRLANPNAVAFTLVMSSTGNVLLQGRMTDDDGWHTIATYTQTGIASVQVFPQMRTSMNTNVGTVSAWLDV